MAKTKEKADLSTEEKIKQAARKVFTQKGYAATRTRDIAEEAGINLALLNYYFRSKEEILFNIHLLYITPLIESQTRRVNENASSTRVAYEVIYEHLNVIVESPGMLQSFIEHQRELSDERRAEMRANRKTYRRLVEESFRRDVELGVIPPCDTRTVAFSLFGMCNWASRAHSRLTADEVESLATELWQLFVFGTSGANRDTMRPEDF